MTFLFRNISKIGRAILFRVLLFSSLITLLLSGIQLYIEFRNDFNQVNEIQQQIDSSYLKSVETAVWGINEKQAKALLEGIVALPTVTNAKIINEDGSNYVIQNETQAIHDLIYLKELYSPIEGKRQVIATLNVYQTHESAYINLKSRLFIVLVANFLKTFFVALFILSVFHQLVSKHLIYISDFLKNSHIFEDSKPLTLDRPKNSTTNNDELDILAKMFNQQGQALRSSWQELRNSETRYRELTEGSLQGILIVDKRWNYIYANKQLFNILKLKENDEKIKNLRQFFSSEVISILDVFFSKKQDKPVFKDEIELITADKSPAYVQAILMQTTHGEETYTQIVIFDISNFKMLKRKQKSIELQLIQKNKMAAIGTMLSGVTHEINNPNHLIKQNTLILKETWQAMVTIHGGLRPI